MKAMVLKQICSLDQCQEPLELMHLPIPEPHAGELLVRVSCCGVCHTELDEIEGRTPPTSFPMVLGHEVIGRVADTGSGVTRFNVGDRVGIGWIHSSNGAVDENISPCFRATGRDRPGGYAEYLTIPETYAYPIPDAFSDIQAAPLMCAGGIGYRALRLTGVRGKQRLGLMGFGASAHLLLQLAKYLEPELTVDVFAREESQREFALQLGADWAGDVDQSPPEPVDAVVDTTPAWKPVLASLEHLRPGGRLVINAIRKEDTDQSCLQNMSYHEHLWMEKEIKTVANITHFDLQEFLPIAAKIPLEPKVTALPLEHANQALQRLRRGGLRGGLVLTIGDG